MKEIGPEEIPFVDRTTSARGRRREKEKPRRVAQRLENARAGTAHVVVDGEHETGGKLSEWGAGSGKSRAVRKKQ